MYHFKNRVIMKRTVLYISSFILCAAVFCGCGEDFLDRNNPGAITSEDVWSDARLIGQYVNSIYNDRPGWDAGFSGNLIANITDEGTAPIVHSVWLGQLDDVTNPLAYWAYSQVRKTNEFFTRIDDSPVDEAAKTTFKGEVRFLRAFLYFDMVKRYGGVPLITQPQALTDDLETPRNTLDECFDFIVTECDAAIRELPETTVKGRANKDAARALKGRALLYYASPNYNPDNDMERWKRAADASRELIGKYELYSDLERLWLDDGNKESIFEVQYILPLKYHGWDASVKMDRIAIGNVRTTIPVQEMVDAFPMKNGKAISDPASGYDPASPYEGRDNRFYAFIAFNGTTMKGVIGGVITEFEMETYIGGIDYNLTPTSVSSTGYYVKKALDQDNTLYNGAYGSVQPWMEFRYAEMLLNYAEAQNEYLSAPDQSVCDAVNPVRARAGITESLTPGSMTKEQMRELIHNEHYVEFCFEQHRIWDLRRWKRLDRLNGMVRRGAVITRHDDGTFTYAYAPVDPQPGVYPDKLYFLPIAQSELSRNGKLVQNPGW
jgi:hypothetical protein